MDDIFKCNLILIFSFENVQSFLYDTFFDLTDKFWQFYFEVLIALRLSIKPLSMRGSHSERGKVVRKFSDNCVGLARISYQFINHILSPKNVIFVNKANHFESLPFNFVKHFQIDF